MSSKLKRKNVLKPKNCENRATISKACHNRKLSDYCFSELFYSMQLICFTVLYMSEEDGGFDFSKKKLKNFNKLLTKHNQEYDDGGFMADEVEKTIKDKLDFDCYAEAGNFPYRPKMKMYGGKFKNMKQHQIILYSANGAIETYLILALHTLRENYRFSKADIWKWWNTFKSVAQNYAEGMTDDFVMKFLREECDLDIIK